MVCEICKINPVKVKIVKMSNGKKEELNLCENCAKKHENIEIRAVQKKEESHISQIIKADVTLKNVMEEMKGKQCEKCGLDIKGFIAKGHLGCPNCYVVFNDTIDFVLEKIQLKQNPINKERIERKKKMQVNSRKINVLKRKLAKKIKVEEFEKAAQLRDEIKAMEKEQEALNE